MQVQEVILRAVAKQITGGKRQRSSASAIDSCGAGSAAMRNMATPA